MVEWKWIHSSEIKKQRKTKWLPLQRRPPRRRRKKEPFFLNQPTHHCRGLLELELGLTCRASPVFVCFWPFGVFTTSESVEEGGRGRQRSERGRKGGSLVIRFSSKVIASLFLALPLVVRFSKRPLDHLKRSRLSPAACRRERKRSNLEAKKRKEKAPSYPSLLKNVLVHALGQLVEAL